MTTLAWSQEQLVASVYIMTLLPRVMKTAAPFIGFAWKVGQHLEVLLDVRMPCASAVRCVLQRRTTTKNILDEG